MGLVQLLYTNVVMTLYVFCIEEEKYWIDFHGKILKPIVSIAMTRSKVECVIKCIDAENCDAVNYYQYRCEILDAMYSCNHLSTSNWQSLCKFNFIRIQISN